MKNILLAALVAGALAVQAAPSPSAVTATAFTIAAPSQAPMSKAEMKRIRKARKQNGPEVYKGTVAEQRRIVTDAPGAEKEDNDNTPKRERKMKKN